MRTLITLIALALAVPATAVAGGFATASLSPPPEELGPGETWRAVVGVKAHGRTPVDGLQPTLTIRGPETRTFPLEPAGKPGVYVADVVFAQPGTYRYEVMDGYAGQVHTFAPVEIGGPAAVPAGGDFPAWAIAPIAAGALALAALATVLVRRRTAGVPLPQ